jgi:hypothetical protein
MTSKELSGHLQALSVSSVEQLQEQNRKLLTEVKFYREMTRRIQESRITALEVALKECSTGEKPAVDPEMQSLLLNSRKLRRLRSFDVHTYPIQDRLAMDLASELKREKRRVSELKHANSDLRQSAVDQSQQIELLKIQLNERDKHISQLKSENEMVKAQSSMVPELQETLKVLQQKLMQQNQEKSHRRLSRVSSSPVPNADCQHNELSRKDSVSAVSDDSGYSTPKTHTMAALQEENSHLKSKLKDKTVRLAILESALKEKMQTIAVLQRQSKQVSLLTEL